MHKFLQGFDVFDLGAKKLSKHGRGSGGIEVFIRKNISKYFTRIKSDFKHSISFIVDDRLFGCSVVYMVVYLPPEGSKAYNVEMNGVNLLEEEITRLQNKYPDSQMLITGDLNARTKDEPDFIFDDTIDHIPIDNQFYVPSHFNSPRCSKDMHGGDKQPWVFITGNVQNT